MARTERSQRDVPRRLRQGALFVYTEFTDEIGDGAAVDLPNASVGTDRARFQMKAQDFLKRHLDHITVQKLRRNEQLTAQDLDELERILVEEVGATESDLDEARAAGGLGLFVRSLVGLERDAAKAALAGFIGSRNLNANQIEFVNLVIEHLTEQGAMDPRRLYESPFTDFDAMGVNGLFRQGDVQVLVTALAELRRRAAA